MPSSPPRNVAAVTVAATFISIALGLIARATLDGPAVAMPDAPNEPINCVSYTPSHDGRIRYDLRVPREAIAADLKLLAKHVRCVRTYTVNEGLDQVPSIARELGLKVMLGLWIGADANSNAAEVARGIEIARANSDVIEAVIVGNEVLLRRELAPEQLRALIEQVRAATTVPVTYADVWEFWLRNASLAETASFVTVHILPYWEDHPIDIDRALDHVRSIYGKVRDAFPGRRVFIGETGWPSEGRPRLNAVPSLRNEARFVRELLVWAHAEHAPYNLIEAFDQPWKRAQEGTVGGFWGLFSANGRQKFSLTGPFETPADRHAPLYAGALGAILFAIIGWLLTPRLSIRSLTVLSVAGLSAGMVSVSQWHYLIAANRSWLEWLATSAWAISGWLTFVLVCVELARWLDGKTLSSLPGIAAIMNSIGHGAKATEHYGSRFLGLLRFAFFAGVAYVCLSLVFEGRGRDFPLSLIGLPIAVLALRALCSSRAAHAHRDREELLMSAILLLCSGGVLWIETLANTRAIAWCALCALFAAATLKSCLPRRAPRGPHPSQHAQQQADAA